MSKLKLIVINPSFLIQGFRIKTKYKAVTNEVGVLVMTHQPPVYIVQMLPTSFLPLNQTTICNHSASAFCDKSFIFKV